MAAWMEERRGDMGLVLEEPWVQPLGDLLQAGKWSARTIVKVPWGFSPATPLVT